jgi:hypothetical protein
MITQNAVCRAAGRLRQRSIRRRIATLSEELLKLSAIRKGPLTGQLRSALARAGGCARSSTAIDLRRSTPRGPEMAEHISVDDLECYLLGKVTQEEELALLEEHLLVCGQCIERTEKNKEYVKTIRAALECRLARGKGA